LNIIFAGTPDFAAASLAALIRERHNIVAVYTQPDRPAGRGKKLVASPVKQLAQSHDLPVYQPENFRSQESKHALQELNPDLMIVAAYGLILPKEVLGIPSLGCINIHASLLPRWRGAAPIQRATQEGDKETGITIMQMDEGLDTGAMLLKKSIAIMSDETGGSLHDRLATLGSEAIREYLDRLSTDNVPQAEQQNDRDACYAKKLTKAEAEIDWHKSADYIARTVRAFNPWPVAYTLEGDQRIRILKACVVNDASSAHAPGTVIRKTREGIDIKALDGVLRIEALQLSGAKAMLAADFVNGGKAMLEPGTVLGCAE